MGKNSRTPESSGGQPPTTVGFEPAIRQRRIKRIPGTNEYPPFDAMAFLRQYHADRIGVYKTLDAVDVEFRVDRYAAHLLVAGRPSDAPEDFVTAAQYFDGKLEELKKIHRPDQALQRAFIATAKDYDLPEQTVQLWYATRYYDFSAEGVIPPAEWIEMQGNWRDHPARRTVTPDSNEKTE